MVPVLYICIPGWDGTVYKVATCFLNHTISFLMSRLVSTLSRQIKVKVASFNILASSLAPNEFICEEGDPVSINWEHRGPRIVAILGEMLDSCDVVVTQENDQFQWLFGQLTCKLQIPAADTAGVVCLGGALGKNEKSSSNIGVFFNRNKVTLQAISVPGGARLTVADDAAAGVVPQVDIHECIHCEFVTRSEGVLFSVYGAHLKSGEAYASEAKRCGQLEGILRHMQGKGVNGDSDGAAAPIEPVQNPILAMDSNNSLFYEAEYTPAATGAADPVTVSKLLDQYGFRDTLRNQSGLECFKMRHNQGGQPKKFFNIMFDRIDKIVVRKNTISEDCDADYGFLRYDSNMPHSSHSGGSDCAIETAASLGAVGVSSDFIRGIRLSGEKREELKAFCILKVQQLLGTQKLAEGEKPVICSRYLFKGSEYESFARLYPNKNAPSDHPPVSCTIVF